MNHFGNYLRDLRGNRSLREMERITGLSHTYLSTLEKGIDPRSNKVRKPTPDVLKKLADTLSIDYFELMEKAGYINDDDFFFEEIPGEGTKMHTGADAVRRREQIGINEINFEANKMPQKHPSNNDLYTLLHQDDITYLGHSLSKEDRRNILKEVERLFPHYKK